LGLEGLADESGETREQCRQCRLQGVALRLNSRVRAVVDDHRALVVDTLPKPSAPVKASEVRCPVMPWLDAFERTAAPPFVLTQNLWWPASAGGVCRGRACGDRGRRRRRRGGGVMREIWMASAAASR
jgi:hypothetical protein